MTRRRPSRAGSTGETTSGTLARFFDGDAHGFNKDIDGMSIVFDETGPQPGADLSIAIEDDPDPVAAGGQLTYTITVANAGPDTTANVVVTDELAPGTSFDLALGCPSGPFALPCSLGDIATIS